MSLFSNLSTLFKVETDAKKQTKRSRKRRPRRKPKHVVAKKKQIIPVSNHELVREATSKAREIIVEAKAEALSIRSKSEREATEELKKVQKQQRILDSKVGKVEQKIANLDYQEINLSKEKKRVVKKQQDLETERGKIIAELEEVSGLTTEEGKQILFDRLEEKLNRQLAAFVREKENQAKEEADEKVKEILVDAMKHGATDDVPEYTVSVVKLPNEETKGKIIGKSGRNINAFERRTGVDLDLDMSPTEVRLSCFDPVRRQVAKIALEKLVKDGRIQPTRIEDVVAKVEKDLAKVMLEAGKKLCHDVVQYSL